MASFSVGSLLDGMGLCLEGRSAGGSQGGQEADGSGRRERRDIIFM